MKRRPVFLAVLIAVVTSIAPVFVTEPAAAAPTTPIDQAIIAAADSAKPNGRLTQLGTTNVRASQVGLNNVPDDQVVCNVWGNLPSWYAKPTVSWSINLQCNGRWVSGTMHLYLLYKFNETDTWTVAKRDEYIPLRGGDSSTWIINGISHTLSPCFPAYWVGVAYVEVTFYAGSPLTDSIWVQSYPETFLSC